MDKKYLEKIYKLYHKELYIYLLSFCKDHYLAEDLVSDTFFKAFASIENSQENIKFYLFRVGKNTWIDWLRKNKKFSIEDIDNMKLNGPEDVLLEILRNERNENIYKGILSMSKSYKEIVILYYFCDFSLKDIAKSMEITSGAARTLLYRSRKKLKDILKEENYEL
ncbi:RNA polymerase sigma factor [Clostridium sp. DL1XJH146]